MTPPTVDMTGVRTWFFCVGAQKAGTTTLHDALARHPEIFLPPGKETKFFANDDQYRRGVGWWLSEHFGGRTDEPVVGVVDPAYLYFPEAPPRIVRFAPEGRIIVMLRNPADRAYSHYLMSVRRGFEPLEFDEALAREPERLAEGSWFNRLHFSYLDRGFYARQIRRYLDLMPADRVLYVFLDHLASRPHDELRRVLRFLGTEAPLPPGAPVRSNPASMPRHMWLSRVLHSHGRWKRMARRTLGRAGAAARIARRLRKWNQVPAATPPLDPALREELMQAYGDDLAQLREILGGAPVDWIGTR